MVNQLKEQLKRHEGTERNPDGTHKLYICPAGKQTIGYGRNIEDRGLTEDEAEYLLSNDILLSHHELTRALPFFSALDSVRQSVLINMHFNIGLPRLRTFRKMLAAVEAADYVGAAEEMLDSRWATQVGSRAVELAQQMRTGEWM